ncbi:nck-associated protein [Anaeramoeba flamelloides]|uniref:Nck-associated protein n=1 Tax=Anaeramoeba flamelloides TaxID=1746091 RepID=A0AAV7YVG4_9EUKA|nr:nck-associated protein [Anaeramoeba flamelloides]
MAKTADEITILLSYKEGLLSQIYHDRQKLNECKKDLSFIEQDQMVKHTAKIVKNFPKPINEKTLAQPQFDPIRKNAKQYLKALEKSYWTIVNAMEFKDSAIRVLNDLANGCNFHLSTNPILSHGFMDLFVGFIQVILLLQKWETCKMVVILYDIAHNHHKKKSDSHYQKICRFLDIYSNCEIQLHDELHHLWESVQSILEPLSLSVAMIQDYKELRKSGQFSITLKEKYLSSPIEGQFHQLVPHYPKFIQWIVFGILFCPQSLKSKGVVGILRTVLSKFYVIEIYRDLVYYPHKNFEQILKISKYKKLKLKQHNKMIQQELSKAVNDSYKFHNFYRIFLQQEISNLTRILQNFPGLIPPKINIIYSLLGLARYEIMWYLHHFQRPPPKKGKINEEVFQHENVASLINAVDNLYILVTKYKKIIQRYYVTFTSRNDNAILSKLFESDIASKDGFDETISALVGTLIRELGDLKHETLEKGYYDLSVFRLNWFRCEAALSNSVHTSSKYQLATLGQFPKRMGFAYQHIRNIDSITESMDEYGGLHHMYPYMGKVTEIFNEAIQGDNGEQQYLISFLHFLKNCYKIIHPINYDELADVGFHISIEGEQFLKSVSQRVAQLVINIAGQQGFSLLSKQLQPFQIPRNIYYITVEQKGNKKIEEDLWFKPGTESKFGKEDMIKHLRKWQRELALLCELIDIHHEVIIYDTEYKPYQYVKDKLETLANDFIERIMFEIRITQKGKIVKHTRSLSRTMDKIVDVNKLKKTNSETFRLLHRTSHNEKNKGESETIIQRPSIFLSGILSLVYALKLVENSLNIDTEEIMREVLLSQVYVKSQGPRSQLVSYEKKPNLGKTILAIYCDYFTDFATNWLSKKLVYSPKHEAFISMDPLGPRGEFYFNKNELKALCQITGPYGVKVFDNNFIYKLMNDICTIKDILTKNKDQLIKYSKCYYKENWGWKALEKIQDLDRLVEVSTRMGCILQLRELLYEAAEDVIKEHSGLIYDNLNVSFGLYPLNPFGQDDFVDMDCLAQSAGITKNTTVDPPFRHALSKLNSTNPLSAPWELLPYLFAASFSSPLFADAKYDPDLDCHMNNAHLLFNTIEKLVIVPTLLKIENKDESFDEEDGDKLHVGQLKTFIEVSSFVLLQLKEQMDQKRPLPIDSLLILLDKFVENSSLLNLNMLEDFLPFILLRTLHGKFFKQSLETKKNMKREEELKEEEEKEMEIEKEKEIEIEKEKEMEREKEKEKEKERKKKEKEKKKKEKKKEKAKKKDENDLPDLPDQEEGELPDLPDPDEDDMPDLPDPDEDDLPDLPEPDENDMPDLPDLDGELPDLPDLED